MLVDTTQDHRIKSEQQLNEMLCSINFLTDKFKTFAEDCTKKHKIIEKINAEIEALSHKLQKFEKTADQQKQYSRRNFNLLIEL